MYEGAPNHPREDRFWSIIEKYRVITAPTRHPCLHQVGRRLAQETQTSPVSACSVGEPIDPKLLDVVSRADRQQALPHRRYLVADRDRHDPDRAAARHRPTKPGWCTRRYPASPPRSWIATAMPCPRTRAASWSSRSPGLLRTIFATMNATGGHGLRQRAARDILRTAPAATRTAASGSWDAWTTC